MSWKSQVILQKQQEKRKFNVASRSDLKELLFNKLPNVLSDKQKEYKIKNLLQKMKANNIIKLDKNRKWNLDEI